MYWVTSQLVWGCPETKGLILGISLLTSVPFLEIHYVQTSVLFQEICYYNKGHIFKNLRVFSVNFWKISAFQKLNFPAIRAGFNSLMR